MRRVRAHRPLVRYVVALVYVCNIARTARNMGLYKSINICSLVILLLLCATFTVSTQAASLNNTSLENTTGGIDEKKVEQAMKDLIKIVNCIMNTKVIWPIVQMCFNIIGIYMPMSNFDYMDYIYSIAEGLAFFDNMIKMYSPLAPLLASLRYFTY